MAKRFFKAGGCFFERVEGAKDNRRCICIIYDDEKEKNAKLLAEAFEYYEKKLSEERKELKNA